jgi:hypothetical protein
MKEATINAKQAGERGISAKSVKKVTEASTGCTHFLEYADLCSGTDVTRKIQGLNVWISTTKTTYVQVALERISKLSRLAWRVLARRIGTLWDMAQMPAAIGEIQRLIEVAGLHTG